MGCCWYSKAKPKQGNKDQYQSGQEKILTEQNGLTTFKATQIQTENNDEHQMINLPSEPRENIKIQEADSKSISIKKVNLPHDQQMDNQNTQKMAQQTIQLHIVSKISQKSSNNSQKQHNSKIDSLKSNSNLKNVDKHDDSLSMESFSKIAVNNQQNNLKIKNQNDELDLSLQADKQQKESNEFDSKQNSINLNQDMEQIQNIQLNQSKEIQKKNQLKEEGDGEKEQEINDLIKNQNNQSTLSLKEKSQLESKQIAENPSKNINIDLTKIIDFEDTFQNKKIVNLGDQPNIFIEQKHLPQNISDQKNNLYSQSDNLQTYLATQQDQKNSLNPEQQNEQLCQILNLQEDQNENLEKLFQLDDENYFQKKEDNSSQQTVEKDNFSNLSKNGYLSGNNKKTTVKKNLSNKNLYEEQDQFNKQTIIDENVSLDKKIEESLKSIIDNKENNIVQSFTKIDYNNKSQILSNNIYEDLHTKIDQEQQQQIHIQDKDKEFKDFLNKSTQITESFINLIKQKQVHNTQNSEVQTQEEDQNLSKIYINQNEIQQKGQVEIQNEELIEIEQEESIETDQIFTDDSFPPKMQSIAFDHVAYIDKLIEDKNLLVFKRVSEVKKEGPINLFYNNTTSIYDVKQGYLGDCYFIVCMIVLAQHPNIIKSLFKNKSYNEKGKYVLNLIKNGKPIQVVLDDFLPCYPDSRGFAFAQSPNNVAIWPSLVEKAIAKIHQNYLNIEGNNKSKLGPSTSDIFMHLIGCPSQFYYIEKGKQNSFKDMEEAWQNIYNSFNQGYLQTTGVSNSKYTGEKTLDNGLVANHAYSILEVRQFGKLKLIKLKNPWAKQEWKLDWSDKSTCWTNQLKQKVNLEVKDDGIFWMSFQDFYANFSHVSIAFFNPNYQYSYLEIKNEEQFALFQYDLIIDDDAQDIEGSLILNQIAERYLIDLNQNTFSPSSISFCIFEIDKQTDKPTKLKCSINGTSEMIYKQTKFEKGKKYSIMINVDFLRPHSKDIVLSFYGNQKIKFEKKNLIRQAEFKIFCDYIETVQEKEMKKYGGDIEIFEYQTLLASFIVFTIKNKTSNSTLQSEIEFNDFTLLTNCLKYNQLVECQEIEKNKYKITIPSGQTLKWIFKQSSNNSLITKMGYSYSYQILPEKFNSR